VAAEAPMPVEYDKNPPVEAEVTWTQLENVGVVPTPTLEAYSQATTKSSAPLYVGFVTYT